MGLHIDQKNGYPKWVQKCKKNGSENAKKMGPKMQKKMGPKMGPEMQTMGPDSFFFAFLSAFFCIFTRVFVQIPFHTSIFGPIFFAFSDPFFLHVRTHFFCICGPIFFAFSDPGPFFLHFRTHFRTHFFCISGPIFFAFSDPFFSHFLCKILFSAILRIRQSRLHKLESSSCAVA